MCSFMAFNKTSIITIKKKNKMDKKNTFVSMVIRHDEARERRVLAKALAFEQTVAKIGVITAEQFANVEDAVSMVLSGKADKLLLEKYKERIKDLIGIVDQDKLINELGLGTNQDKEAIKHLHALHNVAVDHDTALRTEGVQNAIAWWNADDAPSLQERCYEASVWRTANERQNEHLEHLQKIESAIAQAIHAGVFTANPNRKNLHRAFDADGKINRGFAYDLTKI